MLRCRSTPTGQHGRSAFSILWMIFYMKLTLKKIFMPRQSESFESRETILKGAKWSPCKYCKHPIISDSKVCSHCNRHQNFFFEHLQTLSVAVAIGVLILSIWQAWSATNQATKAEVAMVAAIKAASEAENALKLAELSLKEAKVFLGDVFGGRP